jgi:hypothetical protein
VRVVKGSPPTDIRALVVDFFDPTDVDTRSYWHSRGWLVSQTNSLIDHWRNPLRLVAESPRHYQFISSGANGKDENGQGDDIVYDFDPLEVWEHMDLTRPRP